MKKHILILCLNLPFLAEAQTQDTTTIALDEIVIAENRIQLPYAEQSRSITILDQKTIQKQPAVSVADVLRFASGVDVRTRGANGVQSDIGIRGGTFDQTLVLVNGIKISDPQTGHHSLNLPVDLQNIERIEVLKGPGARTFGQNAFSGAINVVTASPKKSFLNIGLQGGDFTLWGARASGAVVTENQSHYGAINFDQSGGYKYNTDYTIFNGFYNGTKKLGKGKIDLLGGYTDRSFGANGFYASPDFEDQYESIQTGLAAISYKNTIGKAALETRLYYRQNDDEYIFIRNNPEFYRNVHINKTIGFEANTVIPFTNATTGIGVDLNKVTLESNNLGSRERFVSTLFLEHRMEFFAKRLSVTPGVQLNNYSDFGFNWLPGIDLGLNLTQHAAMFANVGYTYRVPTFTDLYYTDPVNVGNPDLEPEFAWNYEIGFKTIKTNYISAQASVFYRDGNNMIDWTRAVDTDPWQPVNVLKLSMLGFDGNATIYLNRVFGNVDAILSSLVLNYTYINATADEPETGQSRYALENLKHQLRIGLNLAYTSNLTHTVSFGYYDRVNLDDYSILDTRINYQLNRLGVFADVTNVFDVTYQETNLVVMPGRWFKMGVNLKLL